MATLREKVDRLQSGVDELKARISIRDAQLVIANETSEMLRRELVTARRESLEHRVAAETCRNIYDELVDKILDNV
jgi:chromosome segregation ATPase